MTTRPGANPDIQIARFANLEDWATNWRGVAVKLGGRGGVVQMWGLHHFIGNTNSSAPAANVWGSALSSNPAHLGDLAFGLDEFMGSGALYGTHLQPLRTIGTTVTETYTSVYTPLYGIIRPSRQIWVLYLVGAVGSDRQALEVYYSEIDASLGEEGDVNRKYGKYRRS